MMIKGVIFDLDGTTIYTLKDIHSSLNKALVKAGYPEVDLETARQGVGSGFINLLRNVLPEDTDEERIREVAESYRSIYSDNLCVYARPYEGIPELLKALKEDGIKLGVNSNKSDKNTKRLIDQLFPDIPFTLIVGMREGVAIKPDPAGAFLIAVAMGLDPQEMAYIGDSEPDIATARNAGMYAVACTWGYRDKERLAACGPDCLADQPADILTLIRNIK